MREKWSEEAQAIVSDNLKRLRESYYPEYGGKSRLAKDMDINAQQWSPWENGQRMPSKHRLEKIAQFFRIQPEFLLEDHRDESPSAYKRLLASNTYKDNDHSNTLPKASPQVFKPTTFHPHNVSQESNPQSSIPHRVSLMDKEETKIIANSDQLNEAMKTQLKSALRLTNVQAIMKVQFSIIEVEFV